MTFWTEPFGKLRDGRSATLYLMQNSHGALCAVTDYGARIVRVVMPDRAGTLSDVALGYDDVAPYQTHEDYFGATCGRVANRIQGARFALGNEAFSLSANDGPNTLHGGIRGLSGVLWAARRIRNGVRFAYVSPDGEEGFPGRLLVFASYTLSEDNCVRITYRALSDRDTPVSLANHTYFNLAGHGAGSVLDHELEIFAPDYTPVDASLLPTGALCPVAGTPFDFSARCRIGERIDSADPQLAFGHGYDHNFSLRHASPATCRHAALLVDPASGRSVDVFTTMPGLQVYTANMLPDRLGKNGAQYGRRCAICLETQHFPNAVRTPSFPSPILRQGETYLHRTELRFGVRL